MEFRSRKMAPAFVTVVGEGSAWASKEKRQAHTRGRARHPKTSRKFQKRFWPGLSGASFHCVFVSSQDSRQKGRKQKHNEHNKRTVQEKGGDPTDPNYSAVKAIFGVGRRETAPARRPHDKEGPLKNSRSNSDPALAFSLQDVWNLLSSHRVSKLASHVVIPRHVGRQGQGQRGGN